MIPDEHLEKKHLMSSSDSKPEAMLARTTVVNPGVQTLVGRLVSNGTLNRADLLAVRDTGPQLASDLRAHGATGAQVAADPLKDALPVSRYMARAMPGVLGFGA